MTRLHGKTPVTWYLETFTPKWDPLQPQTTQIKGVGPGFRLRFRLGYQGFCLSGRVRQATYWKSSKVPAF